MVQTCLYLFGHVCDWCAEDTAVIIQNTYKNIGMLVTQVYIWPLSAVLNALANEIKSRPRLISSTSATHFWKQNKIEELPGWLQHVLATASGTTPLDSAQTGNIGDGKTLDIRETRTLDPQTLLTRLYFTAVFEEVEREREVLSADPLTTVSNQLRWN